MKISNKSPNPMPSADTAKTAGAGSAEGLLDTKRTKAGAAGVPVAGASRVDVSPRAQEMMKAKALATPSDDIDEAKVARLQKMIDSGNYKVDADAIADRMLDEHTKMPL
jgi:negative regulator of flagellin synthesis FlgM